MNTKLLKRLYEIHSPSRGEAKMIKFLTSYIQSLSGVKLGSDTYGNLYAVKGEAETYPCIVAHLDQVSSVSHSKDFRAIETRDIIFGYSRGNNRFENLGADDKNGIFIALECLKKYDTLKVAFFREEEIGCNGSTQADLKFFDDCRFVIQPDRRGNSDIVTSIGYTDLCSEAFIEAVNPSAYGYSEANGMMTDILELKENGLSVSAINLSCGYYNPHTNEEITVKRDLLKCLRLVEHIIETCVEIYPHTADDYSFYFDAEDELYEIILSNPTMSSNDLYDCYHTNFPHMKQEDFERVWQETRDMGLLEEETETYNFNNIQIV